MANNIDIIVRATDATAKAWKSVSRGAKAAAAKVGKALGGLANFGKQAAVAIGLVGAAAVTAGKHLIGFASNAEEIDTKFAAVYKTTIKTARAMSKDLAESFDLADSSAQSMLADTGDILTGFGFSGDAALEMADKVARLGLDLASFTNFSGGAKGATTALTKALLGETESAKSLGIVIRQDTKEFKDQVTAKANSLGISEQQAKAMVILEMATRQSTNAIGDYERTQEGVANRQRATNEAFKQAREELGKAIIEHSNYGEILGMVTEKTKELTESGLIELWAQNVGAAVKWLTPLVSKLGGVFGGIKTGIQTAAAFAGAISGGSSISEAKEIAAAVPAQLKAERELKLAAILVDKQAAADAKSAAEEALMVTEKKLETERLIAETQEKAAKAEAEAGKKRIEDAKKLEDVEEKLRDVRQNALNAANQDRIKAADDAIAKAQLGVAELAKTQQERRDERRDEKRKELAAEKLERIKAKEKKGSRLSRGEREILAGANLQKDIDMAQNQKDIAQANIEEAARQAAQKALDDQLKELTAIKTKLQKNLELA